MESEWRTRTDSKSWIGLDMDATKFLLLISIFTNNSISLLSKQQPLVSSIKLLMAFNGLTMIPQADRRKLRYFSCSRLDSRPSRDYIKLIIS